MAEGIVGMLTLLGQGYGGAPASSQGQQNATLVQRLQHEKANLDARSDKIGAILAHLEENQEIGNILDLISELGGF